MGVTSALGGGGFVGGHRRQSLIGLDAAQRDGASGACVYAFSQVRESLSN